MVGLAVVAVAYTFLEELDNSRDCVERDVDNLVLLYANAILLPNHNVAVFLI